MLLTRAGSARASPKLSSPVFTQPSTFSRTFQPRCACARNIKFLTSVAFSAHAQIWISSQEYFNNDLQKHELMFGQTHQWITTQVSRYLNLNERETQLLCEGSLVPDREQTFPHHTGKSKEILRLIKISRTLFLENNDKYLLALGMLLHYNQDGWTKKPRVADKHTKWEKQINEIIKYPTYAKNVNSGELVSKDRRNYNFDLKVDKKGNLRILDLESYLDVDRDDKYGRKVLVALQINKILFDEDIHRLPLPTQDIEKYMKVAKIYGADILHDLILSYHKEKDLSPNYPYIWEFDEGTAKGVLGGTFYMSTSGVGYRPFAEFSHPYLDLFFSLITSIIISCQILYPIDISPPNWTDKNFTEITKKKKSGFFK